MPLLIGFDSTGLGVLVTSATILFTVVDQWGNAVKNPDGTRETASIVVSLKLGELNISVVPLILTVTAYEGE